jgi:hypothetical protein
MNTREKSWRCVAVSIRGMDFVLHAIDRDVTPSGTSSNRLLSQVKKQDTFLQTAWSSLVCGPPKEKKTLRKKVTKIAYFTYVPKGPFGTNVNRT